MSLTHATQDQGGGAWRGNAYHPEVNWISALSQPTLLPPYFAGSNTSNLIKRLESGHGGTKLTPQEIRKVALWIDLLVPFIGDYREANNWSQKISTSTIIMIRSGKQPVRKIRRIFVNTFNPFKLNKRKNEKEDIDTCWYGCSVSLCVLASSGNYGFAGPFVLADNGKSLFVTNRAGCELIKMSSDGQKMEKKVSFPSPVNAMTQDANGKLWVVCDGNCGTMYELDGKKLSVQSKTKAELRLRTFCIIRCQSLFG